jgi:cyanophycinase
MGISTLLALILLGVEPDTPKGHLVIIGGGAAAEEIRRQTLELAGGPEARVIVIPHASGNPLSGERSRQLWQEAGAEHASVLDLTDPAKAVAEINSANLIFFLGGSQTKLMKALAGTGLPEAILQRFREGAVISGTSAGAAVMSRVMIAGVDRSRAPQIAEGLGLWPEVIVDQHFLRRRREDRLRSVVLTHPELIGVGIDEATAVLVSGRVFEVIGASSVVVMDARKAVAAAAGAAVVNGESPAMQTFMLKAGMKYDLDKGVLGN